jgi:hypothetical protein
MVKQSYLQAWCIRVVEQTNLQAATIVFIIKIFFAPVNNSNLNAFVAGSTSQQ